MGKVVLFPDQKCWSEKLLCSMELLTRGSSHVTVCKPRIQSGDCASQSTLPVGWEDDQHGQQLLREGLQEMGAFEGTLWLEMFAKSTQLQTLFLCHISWLIVSKHHSLTGVYFQIFLLLAQLQL